MAERYIPHFPFVELASQADAIIPTLRISDITRTHNLLPSPVVFAEWIRRTGWLLRHDWQSASEAYRVLNDLHTRQRFTDIVLVYLSKLSLIAIAGKESVVPEDDAMDAVDKPFADGCGGPEVQSVVFVLPGSFNSGVLTGAMRISLDEELQIVGGALERQFGVRPDPGWTLAVTDCDQVCYYVERMLTFPQLMSKGAKSREEELCSFFGRRKAVNDRSLKSRKLQKERKERLLAERLQRAVESELKDSMTGTLGVGGLQTGFDDASLETPSETIADDDWEEESEPVDVAIGTFDEFDEYDALDS